MNLVVALVAVVAVTLLFTLFVRPQDIPPPDPVSPVRHLDERKAAVYENLRDLQFEYRVGKLSDADYASTKLALQKELAVVVAETERVLAGGAPSPAQPEAAAAGPCAARARQAAKDCVHLPPLRRGVRDRFEVLRRMRKGNVMRWALLLASAVQLFALDGTVVNMTSGKPQAGVEINLVQPSQQGMVQLGNTKSGAQGEFEIDKEIPPGPGLVQATYEGTTYNMIITPGMPTSGIQVKVYDSTKKAGVAKTAEHLILIEPTLDNIKLSETFVLANEGNVTYNDPEKGSIQFYLPPSTGGKAQVVVTAPGGMPITRPPLKTATPGFYKIDYPVKPGETRLDVTYTLPAADKLAGKVAASDGVTHLVTPPDVTITGDGIESAGQEPTTKANVYNLAGLDYNLLITGVGSLQRDSSQAADSGEDTGAPKVEIAAARIYSQLGWVLGLSLAILAIGGVMLFRRGTAA